MTQKKKRDVWLVAAVLGIAAVAWLIVMAARPRASEAVTEVYVQVDGTEILRVPLNEDGRYLVADGRVRAIAEEVTLASLGEEASPSRHDLNVIVIRDGSAFCAESNCDNQICVHTAPLSGEAYDAPIVCLPHGMFLYAAQAQETE